jgi:hypothetical protein
MLDSRGFELEVGDEVLVLQHSNQVQLGDMMIVARTTKPFNTTILGTIVKLDTVKPGPVEHYIGSGTPERIVTVQMGKVQKKVSPDSNRVFKLPRRGECAE